MSEESQSPLNPLVAVAMVALVIVVMHLLSSHLGSGGSGGLDKVIIESESGVGEEPRRIVIIGEEIEDPDVTFDREMEEVPEIGIRRSVKEDSLFLAKIVARAPHYDTPSKKTIIRYYVKNKDGNSVYDLAKFGFYIHERPSPLRSSHGTNAIYVGDSVTNADVLLVAYSLIKDGVDLKSVVFSREHAGWKSNSIEVGTDTTIVEQRSITLSDLREDWGKM
ncbi:hypothetical protein BFP72_18360 [Reichenbachiella sp. 5M10]|uniref:hypothetical protein n=1 Tax=Reichenbachiella sp. 5M10 TaxID=1889772 RepID=UPI000C150A35|nr:hypothetical protein [Reichenbachiella sp. 5M10]PIB37229.1 hypothetical protein BFP72_18360 [Reichenbachiella sp. 5M10]